MKNLLFQTLAGILGLYLSAELLAGVIFIGPRYILVLAGVMLGLLNLFIKPVLNLFFFPLKLLTFGLFGLVINIGLVWLVTVAFFGDYFKISGTIYLFLTTVLVWASAFFFSLLSRSIQQRHKYQQL